MGRVHYKLTAFVKITVVGILAGLLAGCVDTQVKNIGAQGKSIVCFGDSVTLGYGVEAGNDYPAALAKLTSCPVINSGIDGDTSSEAVRRMDSDVFSHEPFLVIIEFGGNDFLRKVPLSETAKNIEEMVKQLHSRSIMVALADISAGMIMGEYGKEFKSLCKKYGLIFIPSVLNGIITNPSLKSDFIHPNKEGYTIVAHRVYRAILPYLSKNAILRKFK